MTSINLTVPPSDSIEVSLFGPGIGESICVHLGLGKWLIVDSCLNPETGMPAALEYLLCLGVNVSIDVELIVISHWHNDHIKGLSKIIEACSSAKVVFSEAFLIEEFKTFVKALNSAPLPGPIETETDEIIKVIQTCKARKNNKQSLNISKAIADRLLYRSEIAEVWSLSPSDDAVIQSKVDIGVETFKQTRHRRRVKMTENLNSVAIWISTPFGNVLLGSDLEASSSNSTTTGWQAVLNSRQRPQEKAKFFKIPHHGSVTGHLQQVWEDMIESDPIGFLTEYRSSRLPNESDLVRLLSLTSSLFRTTEPNNKLPRRENTIDKAMRGSVKRRRTILNTLGHIQIRSEASGHIVGLNNSALQVSNIKSSK